MPHLIILVADHGAVLTIRRHLNRFYSETGTENSIEGGRRAVSLKMTQNSAAGLVDGERRDFCGHHVTNSSKLVFPRFGFPHHGLAMRRARSFGDYD